MIPTLEMQDIIESRSGVRAMALAKNGEVIDDFRIVKSKNNLHVLNAPSPAATACLAIGDQILQQAKKHFARNKMIKFLGLLSKKKKISTEKTAKLLVATLDEVIVNGFVEIQDFINDNNNLEQNPNLTENDIRWFRLIVFVGNLKMLP